MISHKTKEDILKLIERLTTTTSSNSDYVEAHILDDTGVRILKDFIKGLDEGTTKTYSHPYD
jgi:hypothetical protein